MFYLVKDDGSLSILHGSLIEGFIWRRSGLLFNRKWTAILSEKRLQELGLQQKAQALLEDDKGESLLSDPKIAGCAYHLGANPEGTIFDEKQFENFLLSWVRESGAREEISRGMRMAGAPEWTIDTRFGMFLTWAKDYLDDIGPEVSPQAFQNTMMRALQRAGLIK